MRDSLRDPGNAGQASGLSDSRRRQTGSLSCLLACLVAALGLTACSPQQKPPAGPRDKALTVSQTNLFKTAFHLASAIPVEPHIKSRSLAQRKVISSLIEAGCPGRAHELAGHIENWHRGAAYADLAVFYAENGEPEYALDRLRDAGQVVSSITTWHRDRILSRMGQAMELLGDTQSVVRVTGQIEDWEAAKVHKIRSTQLPANQYQAHFERLKKLIEGKDFDLKNQGLQGVTSLYERFYNDADRRREIADALQKNLSELAPIIKIDLFLAMADVAVSRGEQAVAMEWVQKSRELFENASWRARFGVPVAARIAERAFEAGDAGLAKQMLDSAEATYRENESEIINMFRADTLIPLAEAFAGTGHNELALKVYKQAVEAAVINVNSRPRAEDLSAICASMAVQGREPDEAFWTRIREIQTNLGDPW